MVQKKITYSVLIGLLAPLFVGLVLWASPVYGGTFQLHTVSSFVESLIERGIISEGMAEKARVVANMITQVETETVAQDTALNAPYATVSVSQYIQYANHTYAQGEDVEGVILLIENTSEESRMFEAKRGCQITYTVYDGDTVVYDSASSEQCQTDERVEYSLGAGETRMFAVTHSNDVYHLDPGTYRFEVTYPGYGSGERTIVVE